MTDNKPKVIIMKGLSGSGKSTIAKQMVAEGGGNVKRVNRDSLRAMLDNSKFSSANERMVTKIRDYIINTCISKGYDIIVDDTNLRPRIERDIRKLVGDRAKIEVMFINVSLEECLKRNAERSGIERVPDDVIIKQAENWKSWQHVDTSTIAEDITPAPAVNDPTLPQAIICDLDGTLAIMGTRSPYEWNRVDEDIVDQTVAEIVINYYILGYEIIIMSGRDSQCRELTAQWLEVNEIPYHHLFMRAEGDYRKDDIIKDELFTRHVDGKWNVSFCLDDRDSIVSLWRQKGLKCLQVEYGNF